MRVLVDRSRCTGHGRCHAQAPELFDLDDEGYVLGDVIDVPLGLEPAARTGVLNCPERAISVEA